MCCKTYCCFHPPEGHPTDVNCGTVDAYRACRPVDQVKVVDAQLCSSGNTKVKSPSLERSSTCVCVCVCVCVWNLYACAQYVYAFVHSLSVCMVTSIQEHDAVIREDEVFLQHRVIGARFQKKGKNSAKLE